MRNETLCVSGIRILPEAGSRKKNEYPAQTAERAYAEPVKMSFCIQDSAHSVHTNQACNTHTETHIQFFFRV